MSEHANNRDIEYYQRREQQERDYAARTEDSIAKRVHLEMAERYSSLLTQAPAAAPSAQS